jgi:hypothetical protein
MRKVLVWSIAAAIAVSAGLFSGSAARAQWGTIKGQVTYTGVFTPLKNLVNKDDGAVKDSAVCAAHNVPDESLVVDPATQGVANVVVWLAKKPAKIHPDLVKPAKPLVDFDQKGCKFIPHILLVRTDQKVRVLSDDAIAHNTHTYPIKNKGENFIVAANDRVGVEVPSVKLEERLPIQVKCDIHAWMQAYWVILDHPYAAVTNEKGEFEIANVPQGEQTFVVWQEKAGYINKKLVINVKSGENTVPPIKVTAADFAK